MPHFVVCVPTEGLPASVAPCGDVDGVFTSPVVMQLAAPGDIQFGQSDHLFAYGFSAVLIFWALGIGVGAVLSVIRSRS